jgi:ubiquinone/menaquinone biosynthesis C-methylase UbiE
MPESESRHSAEEDRIRSAYKRYRSEQRSDRWELDDPANALIHEERQIALRRFVESTEIELSSTPVLDVGCGSGRSMADWIALGADPESLAGIDLLMDRIAWAEQGLRRRMVGAAGTALPFTDDTFGVVSLFTVLSSILDDGLEREIAREIQRVLRPDGHIFCYDMRYPNPMNGDIRRISLAHLRKLFQGARLESRTLTLVPEVARRFARAQQNYQLLARWRLLRSHRLTMISFTDVAR